MDPAGAFVLGFLAGVALMWFVHAMREDNRPPARSTPPASLRPTPARPDATSVPPRPVVPPQPADRPGTGAAGPPPAPAAKIVTRTTAPTGHRLHDVFAVEGERGWTRIEDAQLVAHYAAGESINQIAVAMQLDIKDVAARLIRLLLDPVDPIDDDDGAPRAHTSYSEADHRRMEAAYRAGVSLPVLARELGRSQLGLGWRMLDRHIPTIPDGLDLRGG